MVKRKTAGSEIQALRARIAELEKEAEDEIKGFVASIRDSLKAAKIEYPRFAQGCQDRSAWRMQRNDFVR